MIVDQILQFVATGQFVEVYQELDNLETFSVGVFLAVDREQYILATVDETGEFDGFHIGKLDSILFIGTESQYLSKFKSLPNSKSPLTLRESFGETIATIVGSRDVVNFVYHNGDSWIGSLVYADEEVLAASIYFIDGTADGQRFFRIRDILRVEVDTIGLHRFKAKISSV
ncbi:hypothetical protein BH11ARM1_BH11ARM1_07610 [soil metagenome]